VGGSTFNNVESFGWKFVNYLWTFHNHTNREEKYSRHRSSY